MFSQFVFRLFIIIVVACIWNLFENFPDPGSCLITKECPFSLWISIPTGNDKRIKVCNPVLPSCGETRSGGRQA